MVRISRFSPADPSVEITLRGMLPVFNFVEPYGGLEKLSEVPELDRIACSTPSLSSDLGLPCVSISPAPSLRLFNVCGLELTGQQLPTDGIYPTVTIAESDDLRGDPELSHQSAPVSQDARNSTVDAGGIESITQCSQQIPQMMAAAADGLGSIAIDTTQLNMSVTDPTAWATAMNNLGMVPVGLPGQQLVSDSICVPGFDPGLNMMTGIAPINPMIPGLGLVPPPPPTEVAVVKEIIHCKSCTLFPQNPNLPPPSTRERPPGCKTVFVGGLPENATEEIIQEVFEQCGDITAIRKSKKNFCHIRFAEEFMVDKAIYLSGYRMRLGSSTDKKDSGRLHVDFAQARDDFYEWECKQRMRAREERHRRKLEEDRLRPPSPPAIMHYSEHEATLLAEKLKVLTVEEAQLHIRTSELHPYSELGLTMSVEDDSKFSEAITVLLSWIERGEVNRRSANQFYSMVQSANSHVRRLMNEKATHEQEMEEAKENFKNALTGILTQYVQQHCTPTYLETKPQNAHLHSQLEVPVHAALVDGFDPVVSVSWASCQTDQQAPPYRGPDPKKVHRTLSGNLPKQRPLSMCNTVTLRDTS
ncbi:Ecto-NOX disulfide-thiol exchanger 1 [Galemys pyrenaicus]|uniref:Ecto-NOX disulfide-thiol exchanger 1 n=1 Tax=Galemys pyrenaicus TaxID=202257 RepID=A0A8J6DTK0_GALPY|nr:Ecto-NOX disulfide-thiol exchanger 1 [Galemys pyrenaicus]